MGLEMVGKERRRRGDHGAVKLEGGGKVGEGMWSVSSEINPIT
jgi:hypothetical protein